jgi:LuxR family maltose regulon positive regulatory protein
VLDELCGSLCDRTLASSGSAEALVSIEQTNRFLVPLDHRREWYRYHRLFRDLLQAELVRAEPGLVAELHRRAADWYEENGRPETAVEHVIASGDRERAAHLVCRSALPAYQSGHLTTASRWLTRFTEEEVEQHPWLAVTAGWICAYTGRPMEAVRWAAAAERGSYTGPPPDGSASIESARAFLRAAMCPNGVAALVGDAELIESAEPQWSPWRPSALVHVFFARQLSGDNEAAEAALENLIALVEPMNHTNMPFALTQRSLMAMDRGEWCAASADLERARALIAKLHIQEYGASAAAFAASARLAAHDQDLDAARDYLAHAMRLRPQYTWALPVLATKLRLELARVLLALADPAGARSVLREVDEILRHRPELGTLNLEIDNLRHRLNTSPGGTAGVTSLSPAELRLLPYLQTHLTHREIGQRLYISMNTVRTHTKSIYRKLNVSTRTGAVEKARLVGLLAG